MKNLSDKGIKEIKKWLNIDTYRQFENISLERLYHELVMRSLFFKSDQSDDERWMDKIYANSLFRGDPFLITDSRMNQLKTEARLSLSPYFSVTTTGRLAHLCFDGMEKSLFGWDNVDDYWIDEKVDKIPVAEAMPVLCEYRVMIEIDLTNGSDEEIAESLKAMLPKWRKIRKIEPESLDTIRFGHSTIKKIIDYRLIPLLDILTWAKHHDIRVSDAHLSSLLYDHADKEGRIRANNQIKDTDRPLALKAVCKPFILQFHHFLNKNNHLKEMRVSDVITLADKD
ncbi:DUF6387 family protein [Pectobacterium odoriferum]|uniref:DUF6387 family protein n=1 Tax=Pectobacterium odoriferum TaxID=78398 RepID=UPI00202D28D4|nr:DUF6387 family protein [Pectobacterium carotovorum]MCL6398362.1 hypothetical protein [Pectobacterium carotovorum subsp. carotovorum]